LILSFAEEGLTTSQRNILVDSNGIPRISEYGLEIHLRDRTSSKSIPTNVRWMAPEVLSTEKKTERVQSVEDGKPTDVYSFAVVMYEVGQPRLCFQA